MGLEIETLVLGPLETNTYLLHSGPEWAVVDPGISPGPLLRRLKELAAVPRFVWLTHGHGDHIAGVGELKKKFPAVDICCPAADGFMLPDPWANLSGAFGFKISAPPADRLLLPGEILTLGDTQWTVLDTAGHTPGGVSYHCPAHRVVLTGDALFAGSIGRTDLPGADPAILLGNIRRHLLTLDEETRLLPGHGPATTVGEEKRGNPFLQGPAD